MNIEAAKILVVDDDQVMRMFVVSSLNRLGAKQVAEASDGQQGLRLVGNFAPNVVLTDLHMHPMNGLDFIKQIRAHPVIELRKIPILVMSADSSTDIFNDSLQLGIAGYIIKPPVISVLKVKLERALRF